VEQIQDVIIIDNDGAPNVIINNHDIIIEDNVVNDEELIIINDLEVNNEENFIIEGEVDSESDEEDEEQITEQEALVRYALTLDIAGTAAANN
jgi:hypothetical protein